MAEGLLKHWVAAPESQKPCSLYALCYAVLGDGVGGASGVRLLRKLLQSLDPAVHLCF